MAEGDMQSRPVVEVSVLVVVRNGLPYLDRCLSSLTAQQGVDFEVVLVDNASTDGTLRRVARRFSGVRTVSSPVNLGYAGGINLGLEHARGRVVVGLNVDTEMAPGCLARLLSVLRDRPEAGVVTPLLVVDQHRDQVNAMGGAIHVTGLSFCNGLHRPRAEVPRAPFSVPGFSGACFMIRRDILERVGGAPDHCFMGNDDVVLSWWVRLLGQDILCVPDAVVFHRYGLTLEPDKLFLVERNRLDLLLSALRPTTLAGALPIVLAVESAILAYCGLRGRAHLAAKLAAYRAVWTWRQELLARRKRIQAFRTVSDRAMLSHLRLVPELGQLIRLLRS